MNLRQKMVAALQSWGLGGAFLLALIDSAGVPLPGGVDAVIVLVGITNPSMAWATAAASVLGSAIGSMLLFLAARKGGELYLERHTISRRAKRFREWFKKYGLLTVFVPTAVPIPGLPVKIFVLSAGALGVRAISFLAVILTARIPRYFGLAWLGMSLGPDAWLWIRDHAWHMAAFSAALFAGLYLSVRIVGKKRRSTIK